MRSILPTVAAMVLLQACTVVMPEPVPVPPEPPPSLASCHAEGLDGLIGMSVRVLPVNGGWASLRIIRPGMMVTMDYSATRLNVQVDRKGTILSLYCG
jgi:hypothetical protein